MAIYSLLADLIHQYRLARCEEDDATIDARQIDAHDGFAFGRLVCAGQLVRFTVRADLPVNASIKLEDSDDVPALRHSADSVNLSIEYLGERTAEHVLIVENGNPVPVEVVVEIVMGLRGRTPRTMIEDAVNVVCDALERATTRMVRVFPAKRAPGREDGTESADSSRSTGA
ncbi:MAG: hypothetical protein JST93_09870 [Acidobacteria bacterium]|nr:hypothetical protein [Acidobacteriota bacterium]